MPAPGTDKSRQEVEYEQEVIRPSGKGKFDSVLNRRAREGWKVFNIAQTDSHFLVTYIKTLPQRRQAEYTTTVSHGPVGLDEDLDKMIMQGYSLHHFSSILSPRTANLGLSHNLVYTCVWRRSRRV